MAIGFDNKISVPDIGTILGPGGVATDSDTRSPHEQWLEEVLGAMQSAVGRGKDYLGDIGLDTKGDLTDYLWDEAKSIKRGIPTGTENLGQYFENLGQTALDTANSTTQTRGQIELDKYLSNRNSDTMFGGDTQNTLIDGMLGNQRVDAETYLTRMLDRGVITDTGRNEAMKSLGTQEVDVRQSLSDIAEAIAGKSRGDMTDFINSGRDKAASASYAAPFDAGAWQEAFTEKQSNLSNAFGQEFRSAAPKELFNMGDIVNAAGYGQGPQNTKFIPGAYLGNMNALDDKEDDDEATRKRRGEF
jgi:hypothetical protein